MAVSFFSDNLFIEIQLVLVAQEVLLLSKATLSTPVVFFALKARPLILLCCCSI